jgi:hypothetical protein
MAVGVRIQPQPGRNVPDNAMVVIRDLTRPFDAVNRYGERLVDVQPVCSKCGVQHFHKTFHLQLRAGSVIVSEAVWDTLQRMVDDAGFEFVNYVEEPPAQGIAINAATGVGNVTLIEKYVTDIAPTNTGRSTNGNRRTH